MKNAHYRRNEHAGNRVARAGTMVLLGAGLLAMGLCAEAVSAAEVNGLNVALVEKASNGRSVGYFRQIGPKAWREESSIDSGKRNWTESARDQFSVYLSDRGTYLQMDLFTKKIYYSDKGWLHRDQDIIYTIAKSSAESGATPKPATAGQSGGRQAAGLTAESQGLSWARLNRDGTSAPRGRFQSPYSLYALYPGTDVESSVESMLGRGQNGGRWYLGELILSQWGDRSWLFRPFILEGAAGVRIEVFDTLIAPKGDLEWKRFGSEAGVPSQAIGFTCSVKKGAEPMTVYPVQYQQWEAPRMQKYAGVTWQGLDGVYLRDPATGSGPLKLVKNSGNSVLFLARKP